MPRVVDPCPVCSGGHKMGQPCRKAVLNGIDSANERAWNAELDPLSRPVSDRDRSLRSRLAEGFDYFLGNMED